MSEREDCRISCTPGTGLELAAVYAEETERFFGSVSSVSQLERSSVEANSEDEMASDNEGDLVCDAISRFGSCQISDSFA